MRIVSCDELTAIQALERAAPTQPMQPGQVERREFEYLRHGTLSLISNFEVATGQVIAPSLGPTRTEVDVWLRSQSRPRLERRPQYP